MYTTKESSFAVHIVFFSDVNMKLGDCDRVPLTLLEAITISLSAGMLEFVVNCVNG